jgi:hypothetical protein
MVAVQEVIQKTLTYLPAIRGVQILFSLIGVICMAIVAASFPLFSYFAFYMFVAVTAMLFSACALALTHFYPHMYPANITQLVIVAYDAIYWLFWVIASSNVAQFAGVCRDGWGLSWYDFYKAPNCGTYSAAAAFGKSPDSLTETNSQGSLRGSRTL